MTRLALLCALGKGIDCFDYDQAIEWEKSPDKAGGTMALSNIGFTSQMTLSDNIDFKFTGFRVLKDWKPSSEIR